MRNTVRPTSATSSQLNHAVFKRKGRSGERPRGISALALAGLFGLLNSVACGSSSSSSSSNEDANLADTSADRQQGADTWVVSDAGVPVGLDALVDTRVTASVDTPVDTFVVAPVDASVDAPADAFLVAPIDASVDAPVNASVDASVDAFVGPPVDASVCTQADGGVPGTTCASGQVCSEGICQRACGVGQTLCSDDVCHALMNENANCGWCGSECSLDKQCVGGECTCIVPGMCPS
jgi:hypothetical protein